MPASDTKNGLEIVKEDRYPEAPWLLRNVTSGSERGRYASKSAASRQRNRIIKDAKAMAVAVKFLEPNPIADQAAEDAAEAVFQATKDSGAPVALTADDRAKIAEVVKYALLEAGVL